MATDVEWAWAAGFIDGEASLYFQEGSTPCMAVGQKARAPLDVLRGILGTGSLYHYDRLTPAGKWSELYTLYIGGRKRLPPVLVSLVPYLVHKRAIAQEMIDRFPPGGVFKNRKHA